MRKYLLIAKGLALFFLVSCGKTTSEKQRFLIGSYSNPDTKQGIYLLEIDFKTLSAEILTTSDAVKNPSYLLAGNHQTFYAVSEDSIGQVAQLSLAKGGISLVKSVSSGGMHPCYLGFSREDQLMAANYSSGSVIAIGLDEQGNLSSETHLITHHNHSVNPERQSASYLHFAAKNPWMENAAFGVDLGGDKIYIYQTAPQLKVIDSLSLPAGSGCRHLAFHPKKKWLYSVNELNSTVSLFKANEQNRFEYVDSYKTLASDVENYPAGILIDREGRHLYASNRGANDIACFDIDEGDGHLSLKYNLPAQGDWPRSFALTNDEKHLLVANQRSNLISVFALDPGTNRFTPLGISVKIYQPSCIVPLPQDF